MNVAVGESGKTKLSAVIDYSRSHAAHFLDGGIVADGHDFRSVNGDSLRPGLFRVFGVHAPVDHDDVCGFDDESLRTSCACIAKKDRKGRKHDAAETGVHRGEIPFPEMSFKT